MYKDSDLRMTVYHARELEILVEDGTIYWRKANSDSLNRIVDLADLKGEPGTNGENGDDGVDGKSALETLNQELVAVGQPPVETIKQYLDRELTAMFDERFPPEEPLEEPPEE